MDPLITFVSKYSAASGKKEILEEFLSINENVSLEADRFFEKYGGGYFVVSQQHIAYNERNHIGRINAYFDLFNLIKTHDPEKFRRIHKGTPYCILGWLFIDIGDYGQGIFYIDAAISEDVRIDPFGWKSRPSYGFMALDISPGNDDAKRFTKSIKKYVEEEIEAYNINFKATKKHLTSDFLVTNFVEPRIDQLSHRTLVSSLYIYILEAHKQLESLRFRSDGRGSIEPFLTHLHKGSLLLESVLKEVYSSLSNLTLGKILNDSFVKEDLKVVFYNTGGVGHTLGDIVDHLMPKLPKDEDNIHNTWLTLSLRLRNATSHTLLWPDTFNEKAYMELYRQILFALFFIIKTKY